MDDLTATELKRYWPIIEHAVLNDGPQVLAEIEETTSSPAERRIAISLTTLAAAAVLHAAELRARLAVATGEGAADMTAADTVPVVLAELRTALDVREEQEVVHRFTDGMDWPEHHDGPPLDPAG